MRVDPVRRCTQSWPEAPNRDAAPCLPDRPSGTSELSLLPAPTLNGRTVPHLQAPSRDTTARPSTSRGLTVGCAAHCSGQARTTAASTQKPRWHGGEASSKLRGTLGQGEFCVRLAGPVRNLAWATPQGACNGRGVPGVEDPYLLI